MEQGLGSESTPVSGSDEKSRVLNVRPLRCLVPIFPSPPGMSSVSSPQASPFVCVPPTGPFPPGVSPVFPFLVPSEQQKPQTPFDAPSSQERPSDGLNNNSSIPSPIPISSFRTPTLHANGNTGSSKRSSKGNSQRKTRSGDMTSHDVNIDSVANNFLASFISMRIDATRQSDGDKEVVRYIIMMYNFLRRRISQVEESEEATPGVTRRPDLKAGSIMNKKGIRTNMTKRVGAVPGVEVGDIYFFRVEMCLVGLHAPIMGGIDYMNFKMSLDEEPVAVSIVSSGSYEDNDEDGEVLIYSGQGGVLRRDKNLSDQKLERGNLALEKSLHRGNEVRVIRGVRDEGSSTKTAKVYLYDGLYKILESWVEKDKSGCNVFKYRLVRGVGQPEAFTLWKSIQQWKSDITSRVGVILPDLTLGAERLPVCLVNNVDHEKGPAHFTYFPTLKYPKPVDSPQPSSFICACRGGCQPNDLNCPCIQKNGGLLSYTSLGVLLSFKTLIYECGPSCLCPFDCRNRVSQAGLKVRLEVYRTEDKGWGLRSWDPIRSGAFICEYAGEVIHKSKGEEFWSDSQDNYIFDASRTFEPVELMPGYSDDSQNIPSPLVISGKEGGNVARFMNHSCTPNVYWQPVLRGESYLHIAFFAVSHIPPMKELTYDYGIVQSGKPEPRKKKCLCGSLKCRGYYY